MESKKINQLATNVNPQTSDLTTIGDPITGQLKKITWLQVAHLIGAQASVTLQQVTDNGNTTTLPITTAGLTLTNLNNGIPYLFNNVMYGTYGYGLANGVATLDSGGKIPASQLPSSVMEYKGTWNASTNTPTLADGTGDNGDVYLVNVAGSQNLGSGTISFAVGDWVVYNGTIWQKSLNSNAVASVFGRTGTIVAQEGDYNIDQLGDVAITSAATNDYLRYNGSSWVNTQFPTFVSSDKLVLQVRNNSGATINKGTVVYINGATAGYPTIAKALANDDATSAQTIGMVQDNISNNSNGVVVIVGQITGVDTSAYTAGTQLYLSGTTAGAVTSTKPYAPLHLVYVGIVTTQNAVNGVIEVKVQNGVELEELHNVDALNPNNNDGIFYNSTSELWEHKSIATVLGYTPEQPLTFSSPLVRATNTISIPAATGSVDGYLTSTDWTTFNNKQNALTNPITGTGTTNTLPKFTGATTLGNSNVTDSGTLITLGSNSYVNGSLGIGTASPSYNIDVAPSSGSPVIRAVRSGGADVRLSASVTATGGIIGTYTSSPFLFYINGAEVGRFDTNGALGIGTTSLTEYSIRIQKGISGGAISYGISNEGAVANTVTNFAINYQSSAITALSTTLTNYVHYNANVSSFASSTITNLFGFRVNSSNIEGTNNYGFYGDIPSGTNRWNIYMNGTANNYLAGSLGIGTTNLTGFNLRVDRNITGQALFSGGSYGVGIWSGGQIQSDEVGGASYFRSNANTQAATFTTGIIAHYDAVQGTFGANSTVTSQVGFLAQGSLTGATNNFGFYGNIASGTNRWNLYMNGTANNYLNGSLYIGSASLVSAAALIIQKQITGATTGYGVLQYGTIQSDVTNTVYGFKNDLYTQATSFTLSNYYHFASQRQTIGAGSSITNQYGFAIVGGFTDAGITNNYAFYSPVNAATNTWNLYMAGTANNYLAGSLGIGTTSFVFNSATYNLNVNKNVTGTVVSGSVNIGGTIQSDVTSAGIGLNVQTTTAAAAFTLSQLRHISVNQTTLGAGSTVSNQYGVYVDQITNGSSNFAFFGNTPAQTNTWNLYMNGTANNYLAGSLGIGATSLSLFGLRISKTITGGTIAYNQFNDGSVQSDVTSEAMYYSTNATTAASAFTLTNLFHYRARYNVFGAGSAVTNQYGFYVDSALTAATNNYGFYGNIASGANRWNLYMNGTAANYLAGSLNIGTTSVLSDYPLNVQGTVNGNLLMRFANTSSGTSARLGLILNTDFGTLGSLDAYGTAYNIGSTDDIANGVRLFASGAGGLSLRASNASGTIRFYNGSTESARFGTNGALGIGTTSLTGWSLRVGKNITGATSSYGISSEGSVQSDVTTQARGFNTFIGTQATSFTLPTLYHYFASQGTFGAGSTVTNQHGFSVDSGLTGATNNYAFFSNIAAGSGRWNLYMNGTANNYLAGSLGIGSTSLTQFNLRLQKNIVGDTTSYGISSEGTIQSTVTVGAAYYSTSAATQATTFTLANLYHYVANQGTLGAGSTITNQYGFFANTQTNATNNFGFYGNIASGANRWNLYMNGTAANYLAGNTLIGTTTDSGFKLDVNGTARVQGALTVTTGGFNVTGNSTLTGDLSMPGYTINNLGILNITNAPQGGGVLIRGVASNNTLGIKFQESTTDVAQFLWDSIANYIHLRAIKASSNIVLQLQGTNVGTFASTGLTLSGASLTGTNAQSLLDLSQTWNTTGYPTAIKLNITNTASGILANLMDLQVGGATQFLVDKAGAIKTSAPSGGTAGKWKLGSKVTATVALVTTDYIELEVDGVAYKVGLVS